MKNVFLIAEAGVNHNGKIETAFRLCDAAMEAGVDAIKFQTWKTENIVTKSADLATYQKRNIQNKQPSQYEMLKELELGYDEFVKIKEYCDQIGISFLSTPDDFDSLNFLISLDLELVKVGSGDVNNIPFLRQIGNKKIPVILSTGMAYLGEVEHAYNILLNQGAPEVTLLHCTTNYPCPMNEVNLAAMKTLKESFKCKVGYSDHTLGIEIPVAAVAMGAEVIEKHFTLDKDMEGPDHSASLDPVELKAMVNAIRNIELALGDGIKRPNASEIKISEVVKKRIVALKPISNGETFTENNITVKRTNDGIQAEFWDLVYGRKAHRNYEVDDPINI